MIETQVILLEMMKWFHAFCEENSISYFMLGGTMLGAARHQGFIPWDDDIDVGIPRNDYNRLLRISRTLHAQKSRYIIESYHDEKDDYIYTYAKVYDTTTTLIENKRKPLKRGLFIDVFPLDGMGTTMEDALQYYKPINNKLNLLTVLTCAEREGRSKLKNLAVKIGGLVPMTLISPRKMIHQIDTLCEKRNYDDFAIVGNAAGHWRAKELTPKAVFGKPRLYRFEDAEFYGAEDYDAYLTRLYNNWHELPPVEKRVTEHDFIAMDLNTPFSEYDY